MGCGLTGFALSKALPLSLVCLAVVGMGGVLTMASSNTVVQTVAEEESRGRIMSIYTMAFTGTMPLGNLLAGWLAGFVGPSFTLIVGGVICVLAGGTFYRLLPSLRAAAAPMLARIEALELSGG